MKLERPVRKRIQLLLKIAGNLFILGGLAALAWCGTVLMQAHQYQQQANSYLKQAMRAPRTGTIRSTVRVAEGAPIGRLDIPRIGVSVVVLEGTDARTLRLGAGHIPGTALPGQSGNVAIAGHRDTYFRGLRKISQRDEVMLTTLDGAYAYSVDSAKIVDPDDVGVLKDTGQPTLTLVTCYPFIYVGSAPKRFVVQARRLTGADSGR
jgi:sortase A